MLIDSIKALKKCGPIAKGTVIEIREPVTIITGPQKIGKSLLLQTLMGRTYDCEGVLEIAGSGNFELRLFDSEHDNPRIDGSIPPGFGAFALLALSRIESSHGETIFGLLKSCVGMQLEQENSVFLFDEPESGLSLESVSKFVRLVNGLDGKRQMFIVTHHPWILKHVRHSAVFDLKLRRYVDVDEYLSEWERKAMGRPIRLDPGKLAEKRRRADETMRRNKEARLTFPVGPTLDRNDTTWKTGPTSERDDLTSKAKCAAFGGLDWYSDGSPVGTLE